METHSACAARWQHLACHANCHSNQHMRPASCERHERNNLLGFRLKGQKPSTLYPKARALNQHLAPYTAERLVCMCMCSGTPCACSLAG